MQTIQIHERTNKAGTLSLSIPLGQPDMEFEILVVVQPKASVNDATTPAPTPDPFTAINAFRERLVASGQVFTNSVELIREDRNR